MITLTQSDDGTWDATDSHLIADDDKAVRGVHGTPMDALVALELVGKRADK